MKLLVFLKIIKIYIHYYFSILTILPSMNAEQIFENYKLYDQRFGLPHKDKWKAFAQPKVR